MGFSVGVATAIIGVGIALLILIALVSWGFAIFERELIMWWLDVRIRPMSTPPPPHATAWQRFRAPYSAIQSPGKVSSICWRSFLSASSVSSAYHRLVTGGQLDPESRGIPLGRLALNNGPGGQFVFGWGPGIGGASLTSPVAFLLTLVLSIAGCVMLVIALHLFNGLAFAWGQFARLMLGVSDSRLRLAEARATAAHERTRAESADKSRRELIVNVSHESGRLSPISPATLSRYSWTTASR